MRTFCPLNYMPYNKAKALKELQRRLVISPTNANMASHFLPNYFKIIICRSVYR